MLATKKIPYKYKNEEDLIEKIEKGLISRKCNCLSIKIFMS